MKTAYRRSGAIAFICCGLCVAGGGCGRKAVETAYSYESIEFAPYDPNGSALPSEVHTFSGIGFVLPEDPGTLALNPLVAGARVNRFPSGTDACEKYLFSADPKQAELAIQFYNGDIADSRIAHVSGFRAFCVQVNYLGEDCERAIDEATDRALEKLWASGKAEELQSSTSTSLAALAAVTAEGEKLRKCYPKVPVTESRCFSSGGGGNAGSSD